MKKCVGINLGAVVAQTQRNRVVPEVHDKSDGVYSVAFSDPKFLRVEFHMRDEVLLDCHGRPMDPLAGIKLPVVANALALPLGTRFLFGDTRLAPEVGNQTDELIFEVKTPEKANNIFALVKQKTTGEEYEAATWSKTRVQSLYPNLDAVHSASASYCGTYWEGYIFSIGETERVCHTSVCSMAEDTIESIETVCDEAYRDYRDANYRLYEHLTDLLPVFNQQMATIAKTPGYEGVDTFEVLLDGDVPQLVCNGRIYNGEEDARRHIDYLAQRSELCRDFRQQFAKLLSRIEACHGKLDITGTNYAIAKFPRHSIGEGDKIYRERGFHYSEGGVAELIAWLTEEEANLKKWAESNTAVLES